MVFSARSYRRCVLLLPALDLKKCLTEYAKAQIDYISKACGLHSLVVVFIEEPANVRGDGA